jgi:glycosyltransferase involved in cell wall biosynthesis
MPPLVTIGITAFNAQNNIERAVRSALQQDWSNLEVVVVDDASSDQTAELLERLVLEDNRVRLVRHVENLGVAAARNSIIDAASGEFVAFFDDDDESDATRIGAQWSRITRYETEFAMGAPVICHTARLQSTGYGAERVEPTMGCRKDEPGPHGPAVASRILWGTRLDEGFGAVATCSQMARTATYRAVGGFDAAFRRSEDTEFCVRLALLGGHFVGIESPLVRQTLTARADKTLDNELKYKLMLLAKHKPTAPTPGHFSAASGFLRFKYALQRRARFSALMCLLHLLVTHPLLTIDRLDQAIRRGASKPHLAHFIR